MMPERFRAAVVFKAHDPERRPEQNFCTSQSQAEEWAAAMMAKHGKVASGVEIYRQSEQLVKVVHGS